MTESPMCGALVTLVPLNVADAEEMVGVLSGEDLYRFTGGRPPTLDELRPTYARQVIGRSPDGRQAWHNWIIRRTRDGAAVGYVQATIVDGGSRAEIAWVIGLQWQGQGYATESAKVLVTWLDARGVAVIQAHVHPDHAASAAVARRAGLVPTGQFDDAEQLWQRSRPAARERPVMELTLLAVPDCPGAAALQALLAVVLADQPGVTVERREISDERAAAETGMCGSPTLLINGKDPFARRGQTPSLSCRLYWDAAGRPAPAPAAGALRQALAAAIGG